MRTMLKPALTLAFLLAALPAVAQDFACPDEFKLSDTVAIVIPVPHLELDPTIERLVKYAAVETKHRLRGLASYYSNSLDGTLTANGERYHKNRYTAAHLTLPLGCWVEIQSKVTGKKLRLRVNDRGPYVKKFCIDLSRRAARYLGVDVTEDRTVVIRIIALPGELPLSEEALAMPPKQPQLAGNSQAEGAALGER